MKAIYRARLAYLLILVSVFIWLQSSGTPIASASGGHPAPASASSTSPDATCPADNQCFADVPSANPFFDFVNRIYTQDLVSGYACGGAGEPCDAENRPYYRPGATVTRQQMAKFIDNARRLPKVYIETGTDDNPIYANTTAQNGTGVFGGGTNYGVYGQTTSLNGFGVYAVQASTDVNSNGAGLRATALAGNGAYISSDTGTAAFVESHSGYGIDVRSTSGVGIRANSGSNAGVLGQSTSNAGVEGSSSTLYGVWAQSDSNDGVHASSTSGNGIYATSTSGLAGKFEGNVDVTGTCCGSAEGTYRIDDPTDPTHKMLNQSAVESSSMLGLYTGHVTLDANGEAWVDMPSWFQALNEDFDYQLTCVGGYAQVYVAQEMQNNRFKIAGGTPGLKVSWQVTGTRHDPYAEQHPITTVQDKSATEQGTYLHPEVYGQPANK